MIVDLMRNDLTRICRPGTVAATEVCAVQSIAGMHHLVSTVEGELDERVSPIDALLSCFPAGSITGAPKLRAMELIHELEHSARGPYTGSMFRAWGEELWSNVLIRTAVLQEGRARYGAGGAVVAQSIPMDEHAEAILKASPLRAVAAGEGGR
jgi:para-aminobenzoate synthetase component 1